MCRHPIPIITCALCSVLWACHLFDFPSEPRPEEPLSEYGAEANPTGAAIGGGKCYPWLVERGDFIATTAEELLDALALARSGQVVRVAPGARIDLTGLAGIRIPEGVTLAGDRGDCRTASAGPLLFSRELSGGEVLFRPGRGARITGLRIKGPDADFPDIDYDVRPASTYMCIVAGAPGIEVDNCEISNFHRGGVEVFPGGRDIHVHHNFFHDIHAYPVSALNQSGQPILIEANLIYWVWHATAGSGYPGTGYEARYNIIVRKPAPASWQPYDGGHAIDMHAFLDVERARNLRIAGDLVRVHHNTFISEAAGDPSVDRSHDAFIRGVPRVLAEFYNNRFLYADPARTVGTFGGNVWVYNNLYGPQQTLIPIGPQTTPQIIFRQPPPPDIDIPTLSGRTLPLDIDIKLYDTLRLKQVVIELNNRPIYTGAGPPAPGQLSIDLCALDTGVPYQTLSVVAVDSRGVEGRHTTVFHGICQ